MSALTKIVMGLALLLSVRVQADETQEEKVLRLYNWSDYFAPDTLSEFTRETGIRVIYDVMDSSETLEAKLMAGRSGYDLIFPGDTVAERLMRAGSLQPLDKGKLQHLGDIDPGLARRRRGGQGGRLRIPIAEGGEHHLDGHHGDPGGCPPS
ncbi:ABC transporter substrate-binding protein [Aeromonas caviae]|uniref:ABC transporter substrate-binding protein n=1 Tax=Aeromonas caviae TaxID=648 RepID=UPI001BCDDC91|nr:hypothetical protein [Aeromonas caviae]MBS4714126.1 hypothetical protein [Aeromonas caviae]